MPIGIQTSGDKKNATQTVELSHFGHASVSSRITSSTVIAQYPTTMMPTLRTQFVKPVSAKDLTSPRSPITNRTIALKDNTKCFLET